MICPNCKCEQATVLDSRQYESYRRRRYKCLVCGERFTTKETLVGVAEEEIRYGHWMPQILLGTRVWDCSECNTMGSPYWKRCPVCEAPMEVDNG